MKNILMLLCLMVVMARQVVAEETLRVPLRFDRLENTVAEGGMVRLYREYRQQEGQPIVFEAEEATHMAFQSANDTVTADSEASGGYYIKNVKSLSFSFMAVTPGAYKVYLRTWFPLKAFYCHNEKLDNGEVMNITDSRFSDPGVWAWTAAGEYDISAGRHEYIFPAPNAFCAGARLDKVVLKLADGADITGFGLHASPAEGASQGLAYLRRINLRNVKRWQLNYEAVVHAGAVTCEQSTDRQLWLPVTAGSMSEIMPPKPRFLYLRVLLNGIDAKERPYLRGLNLMVIRE